MTPAMLELDFRRPAASRGRWIGWGALVAAVLGVVVVSDVYSDVTQTHDVARSRHEAIEARAQVDSRSRDTNRSAAASDEQTLSDIRRANAVIERLAVPWDDLFEAIERADARELGLLALSPNARDRTIQLAGEARTMDELLAYMDRMAKQARLRQVHLMSYSVTAREGVTVVSFTLAATWQQP